MSPPHLFVIPKVNAGELKVSLGAGESLIFVGANGSGKTRLGVFLEKVLPLDKVQ